MSEDFEREAALERLGIATVRFTNQQVFDAEDLVVNTLTEILTKHRTA